MCIACEVGTYKPERGDDANCTACPAAASTDAEAQTEQTACRCNAGYTGPEGGACTACPQGSYAADTGLQICTDCTANTTTANAATAVADACACQPDYGFTDTSPETCVLCPVGTKQTEIANAVCTSCPSGASNAENASVCTCKRGHNGTADDAACTPCAVGTYKATTGIGECTACPGNATTPDDGSTAETDCACAAGYTGAADACTPCALDTYKPDLGAHNCTACHANSVTVDTAQRAPSACVCDKFYHRSGDACVLCSDTTIKLDVGDTGCEACQDNTATVDGDRGRCQCKKGYNGTADDAECHECLADTYKDTVGTGECTPCPGEAVTFNVAPPWDAVTKCRCPLGYVGADGTACAAALPGFYKSTYGSSNATACPANRTTAESGAKVESDCFCARGYGNAEGAASNSDCALCAPGTIQPNIANRVCEACPVGTSTRWAELVCVCEPGYAGDANDTACTACPADTYKPARGIGNCTRCPEHAVTIPAGAASASTALTDCTCPPGFFGENGTACTACPVGTFKS